MPVSSPPSRLWGRIGEETQSRRRTLRMIRSAFRSLTALLVLTAPISLFAQEPAKGDAALLKNLTLRPLGPASMGGRVTDLAVDETHPATYYVATASGGLWKTVNNGTTFKSIFDKQATISMGDIALAPS